MKNESNKEQIIPIQIPVIADYVLSPIVIYNDEFTSINFETEDEAFGRITIQNLDAIKICRGELPPYHDPTEIEDYIPGTWVYKVENSDWLHERYHYEKEHYEQAYEWGNSVDEMLTDYTHYFFRFHDEFVEVITKGFWYEQAKESFVGKPLTKNHPFLAIDNGFSDEMTIGEKKYFFKHNPLAVEILENQAQFCQQKLIEVWLSLPKDDFVEGSLRIKNTNGKTISFYQPTFGKAVFIKEGISTIEDLKNYLKLK
ncbi:hypothetical protein [Sphingobacterium bovistauri]|uniref:DUF3298 domain-containing protein n=1 Tax=Sphingobacterium bovistauri TaxID=2781959 RepID=A0ABS7Z8D6_9SPHI|nr:hypothetical protein [Sphingobacterium bovistauri]MCA5005214.1 hypothetical protein [Sphingobacterium bovistauri]